MIAAALLAPLAFGGCAGRKRGPRAVLVDTAAPLVKNVPISSEWVGTTIGYVDAQIHAQVTGYLQTQDYHEGSIVKRGQLLFTIDPRPFKAAVNLAASMVGVARAQLVESKAEVKQARDDIDRAEANLGKTELDVKRFAPLVSDGTISQREFDDAVQSNLANKAGVAAAKDHYDKSVANVARAEARVAMAQSSYDKANLNLEFTRITAPVDGVAGIRLANIGDLVGPNPPTPLTTVSQINPMYVEFQISEQDYLKFRPFLLSASEGKKPVLTFTLANGEVFPYKGTISIIGLRVEVSTGTLRIRGLFPNPGEVLRPGQYGMVRALTEVRKGALLVPQRAVEELQGSYEVAIVGPDKKIQFREVTVGERTGSYWIIEKGLKPTDNVVIEGLQKIRTGTLVETRPAKLPPWTPPAS